ncbi:MAG: ABC transporter ATP-binding protein [Vicinamibacteria bacterium]|nr:ABC transporter ATP-binding protein [Vicinamibacteria bacterium]MBP9946193.1 ABC transporter ATP-binding protein [Vicinamibacteria bacterium]
MADSILRAEAVSKTYGDGGSRVEVLRDVSFAIKAEESCAVLGPSGSGKSTLLYTLAGLEPPTSGRVWLGGTEMYSLDEQGRSRLRLKEIGFVLQDHGLLPYLTALENVQIANAVGHVHDAAAADRRARELLDQLGLKDRADHLPSALSGGEKQRVAIARAMFLKPRVLLCDEPTGNLDATNAASVLGLLLELHAASKGALVVVTHNAESATRFGRRLMFERGSLRET